MNPDPIFTGKPRKQVARETGIPEATIAEIERRFRARLAAALLRDPACPPRLIRAALSHINPNTKP